MQRKALLSIAIALTMGCASAAFAQESDLSGVTLRVLDDASDVDAVVIAIREERREGESHEGEGEAGGDHEDGDGDGADRGDDQDDRADAEREEREHDDLEDEDHEDREGAREDHDVEREHADEPAREP